MPAAKTVNHTGPAAFAPHDPAIGTAVPAGSVQTCPHVGSIRVAVKRLYVRQAETTRLRLGGHRQAGSVTRRSPVNTHRSAQSRRLAEPRKPSVASSLPSDQRAG